MAEEEVNYASLVFKANKHSPPEAKKEETVYNEVKVRNKTTDQTADTNVSAGFLPDKKANSRHCCRQQVACCLGILCVILLLGIIALCVYFATLSLKSEQNQLKENETTLLIVSRNLTNLNDKLRSENENLRTDYYNLRVQFNNLTQAYTVSESKITNLTAENQNLTTQNQQLNTQNQNLTTQNQLLTTQNQNLTTQNQQLETQNQQLNTQNQQLNTQNQNLTTRNQQLETQNQQLNTQNQNLTTRNQQLETQNQQLNTQNQNLTTRNQQLETQRNNLTEQIRNMEIKWNELNVTRAQWSIDAYCPKENGKRQCVACQKGWKTSQSSCYAINDPQPNGQRTWEGAREDCREKISDLVVIVNPTEKTFISANSWNSSETSGYWIGLRAEGGKWKWVDGRDLTENSWLQQPATDGQCAISVQNKGLKSVSCANKNRWICKKKGLSV